MLKNHPKGLLVVFFTNMGERFGFYTLLAILLLFLQAKFGLSAESAGQYYSWFFFTMYALAFLGGVVADWSEKYKQIILWGQILMLVGYLLLALPSSSLPITVVALVIISLGNGFFKGNLQAVVGQLYDDEKYDKYRDVAFMIFYMGINIGAFFAPFVAVSVRNWWMTSHGFAHDANIPALAHQVLAGEYTNVSLLRELAEKVNISGKSYGSIENFAQQYLDLFSKGYNLAFTIAVAAMVISILVYLIFNKTIPNYKQEKEVRKQLKATPDPIPFNSLRVILFSVLSFIASIILFIIIPGLNYKIGISVGLFISFVVYMLQLTHKEEMRNMISLMLVFLVVIFFWMSFNQNGLTLTLFARDYIAKDVGQIGSLFFNTKSLLSIVMIIAGLAFLLHSRSTIRYRIIGMVLIFSFGLIVYYFYSRSEASNPISPELFQSFNPLFVIIITPIMIGVFQIFQKQRKQISTPIRVGIGLIIGSFAFLILFIASKNLVSPNALDGAILEDSQRLSPYWLISTYFMLTIAEIFLSPLGISFVTKVAPKRFQGLMQGGWLLATAVGNKLLCMGSLLWGKYQLTAVWSLFIIVMLTGAIIIFSLIRRFDKLSKY